MVNNLKSRITKPIKKAISYVIYNKDRSRILIIQRPPDDEDLPNLWGLPAGSLKNGETFEEAVLRSGKEKLGVELEIVSQIAEGELERKDYILYMKEYEAKIAKGEPKVPQPFEDITQYRAWRWGTADDLKEAAQKGSLCCQLYIKKLTKN